MKRVKQDWRCIIRSQKITLLLRIKLLHTTHSIYTYIYEGGERLFVSLIIHVLYNPDTVNVALPNSTLSRGPPTQKSVLMALRSLCSRPSKANIISPSHMISPVQRWLESFVCTDGIIWVGDYVIGAASRSILTIPPLELDQWCIRGCLRCLGELYLNHGLMLTPWF